MLGGNRMVISRHYRHLILSVRRASRCRDRIRARRVRIQPARYAGRGARRRREGTRTGAPEDSSRQATREAESSQPFHVYHLHKVGGLSGEQRRSAARRRARMLARYLRAGWLSAGHDGRISMPLTWALSLTVTNWMVMVPVLDAVAVNGSITAMYSPPAVAKMSKSVRTWVPLIRTLKVRDPAVVQYSSAKCSRTV